MDHEELEKILTKYWGYKDFRPQQKEIIEHLLQEKSALVVLPTGLGKSLCYKIPALIKPGLTLVISPLIALMKNQVDEAKKVGLSAAFVNSSLTQKEREKIYSELKIGRYSLLFVAPERFRKQDFVNLISQIPIALLAVDEAHCVSEWGHDFRPDYTRIKEFRKIMKNPTTIALTATATQDVRDDILQNLGLEPTTKVFLSPIERPNLRLSIQDVHGFDNKLKIISDFIKQQEGAGIIYFSLIDTLEKFSQALKKAKLTHLTYHGRLSQLDRKRHQDRFMNDPKGLMLATPAFGLGVNKLDIRFIIHAEIPGSIEAYYQEVGRAGRDGEASSGLLLYDEDDLTIQMDFIKWANPEPEFIKRTYQLLTQNIDRSRQEGVEYLRQNLHFYHSRDFRLETTLNLLDRWDVLENVDEPSQWTIHSELPPNLLDEQKHKEKLKKAQMKLLAMVNLSKASENIKIKLEEYFEIPPS